MHTWDSMLIDAVGTYLFEMDGKSVGEPLSISFVRSVNGLARLDVYKHPVITVEHEEL